MQMQTGTGHAQRGGIFSQGVPKAPYGGHLTAYADGTLGDCGGGGCGAVGALGATPMKGPGHSYRGGVFSTATPDAPYGSHLQAFADGVLGENGPSPEEIEAANADASVAPTTTQVLVGAGVAAAAGLVLWRLTRKRRRK